MTDFTDAALLAALHDTFGHADFRPGQREIVRGVLAGEPTLAVMPTGGGKSLCYQLPATLLEGLTVVFSPLVALMKDQVDALKKRGVEAAFLNSSQTEPERARVEQAIEEGRVRVLFVAPERFRNPSFTRLLSRVKPVLVAVDEAHCVCEWGDTFRPDYALLGDALRRLSPPRVLALTATAAPDVRADIVRALRMRRPVVKVAGFDRPNLQLEVHALSTEGERLDTTTGAVLEHAPAIVYAATRRMTELLTRHLTTAGLRARAYHAGLPQHERTRTQDAFLDGRLQVVCATNAFGLGIDKPDVRLVLHAELPRSPDAWWQEAGRAGRDGALAIAGLLYLKKDIVVRRKLLARSTPPPQAITRLMRRLQKAGRPLDQTALIRAEELPWWEVASALAFMEAAGLVTRQWIAGGTTPSALYAAVPDARFGADQKRRLQVRSIREQARLRAMIELVDKNACRRRAVLAAFGETHPKGSCGGCDVCVGTRLSPVRSRRPALAESGVRRLAAAWRLSPRADTVPGHLDPH